MIIPFNTLMALIFGISSLLIALTAIIIMDYLRKGDIDLKTMISYAAGVFIGLIFLDLMPELIEEGDPTMPLYVMGGFLFFSVFELILGYHEHHHLQNISEIGYMDLISDLTHNFIDGFFIYTAFQIDFQLGVLAGVSVILHELPQEVSDYMILIYSGFKRNMAILFNVLVSSSTIAAILIASVINIEPILLISFMMGNYIYLATVDLIPEVSRNARGGRRIKSYLIFILGILTLYILESITSF